MNYLVSIIIPVYNGEKHISKITEYLKKNKPEEFEVIIVDDGSKDNTFDIIKGFETEDFKVVHKDNGGVSSARNAGIDAARGKFLWFIDSDDEITFDAFETICGALKNDADIFIFDMIYFFKNKENYLKSFDENDFVRDKDVAKFMIEKIVSSKFSNSVCNKIIKTSVLKENNIYFPEGVTNGEDGIFILNLCEKTEKICYKAKPVYLYIKKEFSATNNYTAESFSSIVAQYMQRKRSCEKHDIPLDIIRSKFLKSIYRSMLHIKRNKKISKETLKKYIKKLTDDPFITEEYKNNKNKALPTEAKIYYMLRKGRNNKLIYSYIYIVVFFRNIKTMFRK